MIRRLLLAMLAIFLALPTVMIVAIGMGYLLAAMGDAGGAVALHRLALALGFLWILDLLGLVAGLAFDRLLPPDDKHD